MRGASACHVCGRVSACLLIKLTASELAPEQWGVSGVWEEKLLLVCGSRGGGKSTGPLWPAPFPSHTHTAGAALHAARRSGNGPVPEAFKMLGSHGLLGFPALQGLS